MNAAAPAPREVEELMARLGPLQKRQGYYFNRDANLVRELVCQLIVTKQRYGYMACPCRLAAGSYERDRDIICPCLYRAPDVREYGLCFCGLYVNEDYNRFGRTVTSIPERRPAEKLLG